MTVLNGTVDILASLQQRVAALEQQLGSDTLQPNVLTVAADGTIGADFSGHVHAQGLDLDAATTSTPPTNDLIRWLRTDTGAFVAELASYYTGVGGTSSLSIGAQSQDTTDRAAAILYVDDDTGNEQAALQATQINRGAMPNPNSVGSNTEVDVLAGANVRRLIASDASSSYPQLPSPQKQVLTAGVVLTGPISTVYNGGTGDWTVTAGGTGIITINYAAKAAATPVAIATLNGQGAANGFAEVVTNNSTATEFATFDTSAAPAFLANRIIAFAILG